jgi:flagellar protein FlbD
MNTLGAFQGDSLMIKLTRLDGEPFVLNADLIRYVERRPDTFITLTTGDKIIVKETMDEVIDRAVQYQQQKYFLPLPPAQGPRQHIDSIQNQQI